MNLSKYFRLKPASWLLLGVALVGLCGAAGAQELSAPVVTANDGPPDVGAFFWEVFGNILNSRALMTTLSQPQFAVAAFVVLNLIVFVETGLLIGFCLPGDSLLVTAGLICSSPACSWNLPLLLVTLSASAIVGDTVGYLIGLQTGPRIFRRENSLFFHKEHLIKAQQFYERHGGITIVLARFMPLLRTFAPVVAGVGRMNYRRFLFYNVFGGIGWVVSMVLFGYYLPAVLNPPLQALLGPAFLVQDHIEKIVILVVLASIAPLVVAWLRTKFGGKAAPPAALAEAK